MKIKYIGRKEDFTSFRATKGAKPVVFKDNMATVVEEVGVPMVKRFPKTFAAVPGTTKAEIAAKKAEPKK